MQYVGHCPSCEEPVDFGAALPVDGTCGPCGRRYMVVVPELDGPVAGDVEVMLLAAGGADGDLRPLPQPFWQLGRLFIAGVAALLLAFALIVFLMVVEADGEGAVVSAVVVLLAIALASAVGAGVLWFLLGSEGRRAEAFDAVRSLFAVGAGFAMLIAATVVLGIVWWFVADFVSRVTFALLGIALAGVAAGWVTARLAPLAPQKHALALGLAIPLSLSGVMLLSGSLTAVLAAYIYLGYLPAILAGAWLSARFGPGSARLPASRSASRT